HPAEATTHRKGHRAPPAQPPTQGAHTKQMKKTNHTTDEVFGVSRDLPLNYVARDSVDGKFINNLSRGTHLVIYGTSKQGKTSLRKHCLRDTDYIVVSCQNRWSLAEAHAAILKE